MVRTAQLVARLQAFLNFIQFYSQISIRLIRKIQFYTDGNQNSSEISSQWLRQNRSVHRFQMSLNETKSMINCYEHKMNSLNPHCICHSLQMRLFKRILSFRPTRIFLKFFHFGVFNFPLK